MTETRATSRKSGKGFTLIETLVAIAVMTLAILAPFEAIQQVVQASRISKQELIAASLAQEAIEYVRFVRTSNYLAAPDLAHYYPMAGLDGDSDHSSLVGINNCLAISLRNCTIDATQSYDEAIRSVSPVLPLQLDSLGRYTQEDVGNPTIYHRSFNIALYSGYQTITVTMTWVDHGTHTMVLTENFYDWL